MIPQSKDTRKAKHNVLIALESLAGIGVNLGAVVFCIVTIYLFWVILSGRLSTIMTMPEADIYRAMRYLTIACKALTISGIVLAICTAFKFYADEVTGYMLFICGAILQWGLPIFFNATMVSSNYYVAAIIAYILGKFQLVGTVLLVVSIPLVLVDLYYKLVGVRRDIPKSGAVILEQDKGPKNTFKFFCWQMPYCRDFLRPGCRAYQKKKPCWWLKAGCYCDEDLLLAAMNRNRAKEKPTIDKLPHPDIKKSKHLTPAQKRERCRQCFIYQSHQEQKYRILSPMVFPVVIGVIWVFYQQIKGFLDMALNSLDRFAGFMSFSPSQGQAVDPNLVTMPIESSAASWVFLICLGIVLAAYLLRILEYFIFKLQI